MKIAIAQINTTIGDFDGNVRLILKNLQKARQQGADLVVFPEMAVCGYPPQDLVEHHSFIDRNQKAIQTIQQETQGLACIVGCVTPNPQDSGRRFQNAAVVLVDGQQVGTYAKRLLPNYDVFDECRHFEPGVHNGVFKVRDSVIGLSICEDMWNDKQFWQSRHYFLDPLQDQAKEGVDILVNIAASPFSMKKGTWRRQLIQSLAEKHGKPVVYVNLVGGNDELIFDGCSLVMNAQGENVVEAKSFEEDFVIVDTQNLVALPPSPAGDEIVEVIQALKVGIQDYLKKCGFQKAVLGLSGGIDSAVTATLAAQALGPENVLGVLMPSMYSSQGSLDDAKFLAKNLNIKTQTIPITDIYQAYGNLFKDIFSGQKADTTEENIQARIRGNILMALSNKCGALLLSTGNKSELAVGYCTLYGDMSGGLSVISDLPKTLVYEVARHLNKEKILIPQATIEKPPSAELRPDQTDQDTLPSYEILDGILRLYVEEHKDLDDIVQQGFDLLIVQEVLSLVDRNEFKRRQASPGLRVTEKAFGIGRRLPIARFRYDK